MAVNLGTSLNDTITGGDEDDLIFGLAGQDLLSGAAGNDSIYGGSGNDTLDGGIGNDKLYGGSENDYLFGNSGSDRLEGGSGNDIYAFNAVTGTAEADIINDASGETDSIAFLGNSGFDVTSWKAIDGADEGTAVDSLEMLFGNGSTVVVSNYFADGDTTSAGSGLVESIEFTDGSADFAFVQTLLS